MVELLGVSQDSTAEECGNVNGVYIGFARMKKIYEDYFAKATNLENTTGREKDRDNLRD